MTDTPQPDLPERDELDAVLMPAQRAMLDAVFVQASQRYEMTSEQFDSFVSLVHLCERLGSDAFAASQDAPASAVRVKPLEWNGGTAHAFGMTFIASHYSDPLSDGLGNWLAIATQDREPVKGLGRFHSQEDAKAAAQALYEACILSALAPVPQATESDDHPTFKPHIHVNETAGFAMMLLEGCPNIVGKDMTVRPLLRLSAEHAKRDIVGFMWDIPFAAPTPKAEGEQQ